MFLDSFFVAYGLASFLAVSVSVSVSVVARHATAAAVANVILPTDFLLLIPFSPRVYSVCLFRFGVFIFATAVGGAVSETPGGTLDGGRRA